MYYIIGDIHGYLDNLIELFGKIKGIISDDDTLIFLGDYIDRGAYSYEVIEYLLSISKNHRAIFLKGNHEDMLLNYLKGEDNFGIYLSNGGRVTIQSYKKNCGDFVLPEEHKNFFQNLELYTEMNDFVSVHAGFNPKINNIEDQLIDDILWIREAFFRSERKWDKTVIFGHTPTAILGQKTGSIFFEERKNIIGIDTGVAYGGVLTCLRWPDRAVFQC